ncbi:unnamed protein product [Linum tenue]|nr:unnamed protein product [Linum tenue]CAI0382765.1 unnamed protein product [Linum tenue]
MMQHLDMALLSAFVERWQPDTNTLHMPFGEISILLYDVHHILRIPVDGELMGDEASPDILKSGMDGLVRLSVDAHVGGKWKSKWYDNGAIHAEGLLVRGEELKIKEMEVQRYLFVYLGSTATSNNINLRASRVTFVFNSRNGFPSARSSFFCRESSRSFLI